MTATKLAGNDLPYWPRFLSRELAAAFVGVSTGLFDAEVKTGKWPAGIPRGERGGRLTWDRKAIEMRADADLGLSDGADGYEIRRAQAAARRKQKL